MLVACGVVLQCCGVKSDSDALDLNSVYDARDVNAAEVTERVMVAAMASGGGGEDAYPLLDTKNKDLKRFRDNFEAFWSKLMVAAADRGLLFERAELFETLVGWVTTVSG